MMKHFYLLLFTYLFVNNIFAQSTSKKDIALQHIKTNADKLQLVDKDYQNLIVSQEVTSEKGITYMYLTQTVDNIPVRNAIMTVIIDAKGKVVSDANSFVPNASKLAKNNSVKITADNAILSAADHLGIKPTTKPILVAGKNVNNTKSYAFPELAKSAIPAKLNYELKGNQLVLTWNLNINMRNSADYWDINIDANSGQYVSKDNFTVYCKHHKDSYARHDDCQINTFNKTKDANWRVSNAITNRAAASYKVFKLPAESPNHTTERQLATDDQFPLASPFGWHDNNGVIGSEYTITRGNNVYAYQDKDDNDDPDGADTDGGSALNFDFAYDMNKDPRESDDAAVTNLFYMVNMMHDITTTVGFTEEFGNFQDKNYSGKAVDGEDDYVLAQAFDGIANYESKVDTTKINNANFSTPNDGFNGTMQMFFWRNSGGGVSIDLPAQLAGFVDQYGAAGFGKPIPLSTQPALKGIVALARDNSPNPSQGCGTISNAPEITGKIAMVDRGICEFGRKVLNAQQAGAIACIICSVPGINGGNGEETIPMGAGAVGSQVTIPSIMMKKSDCDRIKLSMSNDVPVSMTWQVRERVGSEFLDGSLDNGVIAHEFGHGISNRLTGGRLNSACLTNDEQMGEGWSDFFALVTTHEPGDKGTDSRGIGTFASAQKINGGGIRRFPYSTDMKINPETFDYIKGTAAPHPLGEVWASVTWDMYWALIDKYGYDPNLSNKNSGNYKGIYLVMEGMKMQQCNPGFIAGRDAIIKADQVHYNGENNCLLWSVFARRGLGIDAVGGLNTDRNDGKENFDPLATCIENLKIQKTITPSVDAGGEVDVTITAYNHIRTPITNIKITDELDAGMSFVTNSGTIQPSSINGNVLTFDIGTIEYDKPYVIKFKALTNPNNKTVAYVNENFDADINWEINKLQGSEDFLPSYDVFRSPDVSMRVINDEIITDALLISQPYAVTGNNPGVKFWHRYDTEASSDGGFLEVSVNGGDFQVIKKDKFVRNGYNNPIAYGTLAIPSLEGFSGTSSDQWVESIVDLSEYKNKTLVFRYRFVTDDNMASTAAFNGWMIDDFSLVDFYIYTTKACIFADNVSTVCTPELKTIVNNSTGVATNDVDNYFDVVISPNPVDDILYIDAKAKSSTPAQIEIISSDGQLVQKSSFAIHHDGSKIALPVADLITGVYIIKIQSGTHFHTTKIVKM